MDHNSTTTTTTTTEMVRPAAPPPPEATPWVLTGTDRANLLLVLRGTWIFDTPLDPGRLGEGLSRLLVHYPHLAGKFVGGERVDLTGVGVPLSVSHRPDLTVADTAVSAGDRRVPHRRGRPCRRGPGSRGPVVVDRPTFLRSRHVRPASTGTSRPLTRLNGVHVPPVGTSVALTRLIGCEVPSLLAVHGVHTVVAR